MRRDDPEWDRPSEMAWDHFFDLLAGRRTCGDRTCPDPYCWRLERDEEEA